MILAITIQFILLSKGIRLPHILNILLGFYLGVIGVIGGIFWDITQEKRDG